jgi:hypothetical protein
LTVAAIVSKQIYDDQKLGEKANHSFTASKADKKSIQSIVKSGNQAIKGRNSRNSMPQNVMNASELQVAAANTNLMNDYVQSQSTVGSKLPKSI